MNPEQKYKGVLSDPSFDKPTVINSDDKQQVIDWLQDRFLEYGINYKDREVLEFDDDLGPEKVTKWNKDKISITCNFKI